MAKQSEDIFLRIGYWVAIHRDQLRTWWAISILVVDLLLLGYFIVSFTQYSFSTTKTVSRIADLSEPLVSRALRTHLSPVALEFGEAVALPQERGKYTFVAPVTNPNSSWAAVEVRYRFVYGTTSREEKTTLPPASEGYVTQLNVVMKEPPAGTRASVEVTGVKWERPSDLMLYSDVKFPLSNPTLRPVTGLKTGVATRLTANIKNDSVYSFRSVRFLAVVKSGRSVLAVGEAIVERWPGLEERSIEVTWPSSLPLDAEVRVEPVLNLLDRGVYLSNNAR